MFTRFLKDESGATAIEYGLIAALIAVAIIVGAGSLGSALNDTFNEIATTVRGTDTPASGTGTGTGSGSDGS